MSSETGQDTPVVDDEAQTLSPEQQTGNPEAQTDGAEGGEKSPVPKTVTLTEEELRERIERATAKAAAKAERRAFREALKRVEGATQPKEAPERDDFKDDAAYTRAQLEYLSERKAEEKLREREKAEQADRMHEAFAEKAEKAAERYPDFHTVVGNPNLHINDAMAEFIADSEQGAEIAYHLGKNPAKATQLAQMSPIKAARELAKLESELASKPTKPSKAPDPINPVGSRPTNATALPSDEDDIDTWMRKERERVRAR